MFALLGSRGFVGSEFARQLTERSIPFVSLGRCDCDLYDAQELSKRLLDAEATALINCAGYTGDPNVDACEVDKANCLAGNAVLPGKIAEACQEAGIPWGHVSSGCIFSGRRHDGQGFTEIDSPNFCFRHGPCSFYAGTKALGEEILADAPQCYIWRLRIPFSHQDSPRNYLSKLMRYDRLLEVENSLSNLHEFVTAALDGFQMRVPFGTYNLTNPGSVLTSEVVALIRESGLVEKEFRFFASEDEFMQRAVSTPRSSCVLDCGKALSVGLKLTPIVQSLRSSLRDWVCDGAAPASGCRARGESTT